MGFKTYSYADPDPKEDLCPESSTPADSQAVGGVDPQDTVGSRKSPCSPPDDNQNQITSHDIA
jgi:hypothetical protein